MARQKKAKKVGRPKLPKGEAKGRIVPVRFRKDDLREIEVVARAGKQTISEWIRRTISVAIHGSAYQPLTAATGGGGVHGVFCRECGNSIDASVKSLTPPATLLCEECKAKA